MNSRVLAIALVAFLGMMDTFYISIKRGSGPMPCHVTTGCTDVLNSKYSTLAGIPISWFGLAFYLTAFSCAVFQLSGSAKLSHLLFWPGLIGFVVSLGLTAIQAFFLHAYCEYCLLSACLVTTIFLLSFFERRRATI